MQHKLDETLITRRRIAVEGFCIIFRRKIMVKTLWSMLFVLGIIAFAAQVRAEDEAKKPDAAPPKAEGKAEEPKKEEPKAAAPKKETVEKRMERRKAAIEEAVGKDDWDKVLVVLDEIIDDKEINEDDQLGALFDKFQVLTIKKLDGAKASAVAKKLSEMQKDDSELLNELSWTLLDTEGLKDRDLDVALAIAVRANEVTKGESGEILDTLARAHFEKGDLDKAVEFQTKAAEKIKDDAETTDDIKAQVKATLEKYKAKQEEKKNEKKVEKKEEKK
jgi:tetratricopeptide (TPR) repeat protein